jgi:hypothetical protein
MAVKESPAKVQKFTEEEIKSLTTLQSKSQNATSYRGDLAVDAVQIIESE